MSGLEREGLAWRSAASGTEWRAVIGVEVHAQLATRTKLFCGCEAAFGGEPNTRVCPVCSGQPGALPVLNGAALDLALRAALALGCEVAAESRFDRKNYFYQDLPKGYQITQYDEPYCRSGGITLTSGHRVRLNRIHLEEDAGKSLHAEHTSLVDLNRAGVPLIESVTEADLRSPEEAHEYLTAFKEILRYVGASDCDMEKGSLRCDVNVSVHPAGEGWRTKVELKNLNSFKHVARSIELEVARQVAAWESGAGVVQETRLYDAARDATRTMRVKEDESDYRYFPEPDLPVVTVDDARLAELRGALPELPAAKRARYVRELGLTEYDAGVLVAEREVAAFFEEAARLSGEPKEAANWIANDLLRALAERGAPAREIGQLPLGPAELARTVALVGDGTITKKGARLVLEELCERGGDPLALVEARGLRQVQDTAQIEVWCRAALAGQERLIADVKAGNEKALGAAIGPVMKASKGSANPGLVREVLARIIREEH